MRNYIKPFYFPIDDKKGGSETNDELREKLVVNEEEQDKVLNTSDAAEHSGNSINYSFGKNDSNKENDKASDKKDVN